MGPRCSCISRLPPNLILHTRPKGCEAPLRATRTARLAERGPAEVLHAIGLVGRPDRCPSTEAASLIPYCAQNLAPDFRTPDTRSLVFVPAWVKSNARFQGSMERVYR